MGKHYTLSDVGEELAPLITKVDFIIMDQPSSYNVILGRSFLISTKGIMSMHHLKMKFPV